MEKLADEFNLLVKIALGNEKAFRCLFDHYYGKVYASAMLYTKDITIAEDMIQQVFCKLWEKRARLQEIEKLEDYIFIITRNEIISYLRQQTLHLKYLQQQEVSFDSKSHNPEQALICKQQEQEISDIITRLPDQQQKAFRLSRDQGKTYQEIAQEMKLSVHTVRGHISSALHKIRASLQHL